MPAVDLLRHLRYFVAVAEELHFGRAAERLHMSQPPLSQRIRALERRVGGPLLRRTSRHVELTPLGRRLLPQARTLVAQADDVTRLLDSLGDETLHELRIGLPPELPAAVVAAVMAACQSERPEAEVELVQGDSATLERELRAGGLAAALLRHPLTPDFAFADVLDRPLGALVRSDSPLAARPAAEVYELTGQELVLFSREHAPRAYDELLADLRAFGLGAADVRSADGLSLAAGLVLAGAVAITDRLPAEPDDLRWVPLAGGVLRHRASVAWPRVRETQSAVAVARILARLLVEADGWRAVTMPAAGLPRLRPASGLLA
jgi:DNA-binding transcriptional LysR family regulator